MFGVLIETLFYVNKAETKTGELFVVSLFAKLDVEMMREINYSEMCYEMSCAVDSLETSMVNLLAEDSKSVQTGRQF